MPSISLFTLRLNPAGLTQIPSPTQLVPRNSIYTVPKTLMVSECWWVNEGVIINHHVSSCHKYGTIPAPPYPQSCEPVCSWPEDVALLLANQSALKRIPLLILLWVSAMVELIAVTEKRPGVDIIVHPSCAEYQCTRAWCYGGKLRPSRVLHLKTSLIEQISHPIVSSFLLVSFFSGYKWRLHWHQRDLPSWSLSKVISVFMCFQWFQVGNPTTTTLLPISTPCAQRRCWPLRHRRPLSWPQPLAPLIRWCLMKLQHAWKIQIKRICCTFRKATFIKNPWCFWWLSTIA